jgi:hypothetical protein
MNFIAENNGVFETKINGKVIDEGAWNMNYDGDNLNFKAKNRDKTVYGTLSNEEIMKLFELPQNEFPMEQRLKNMLDNKSSITAQPIIMEEYYEPVRKTKSKRKTKKNKRKSKKAYTKKRSLRSLPLHKESKITPDYMKTIY